MLIALAELHFRMKGWETSPWLLEGAYFNGIRFCEYGNLSSEKEIEPGALYSAIKPTMA